MISFCSASCFRAMAVDDMAMAPPMIRGGGARVILRGFSHFGGILSCCCLRAAETHGNPRRGITRGKRPYAGQFNLVWIHGLRQMRFGVPCAAQAASSSIEGYQPGS
ncbi:hypothetical protein FHT97_006038 [Rhizobium sp. BK399]|nr:hypothetical protein [Rhizobium sp. BK399]